MTPLQFILLACFTSGCILSYALPQDAPARLPAADLPLARHPSATESGLENAMVKTFPCPDPSAITPCICSVDGYNHLNMDCSNITSDDNLKQVFSSDFPVKEFYEFLIERNEHLSQLGANVFGNVTFERIYIRVTNVTLVSYYALGASSSRLNYVSITSGQLTESTFPFNSLDEYTNLDTLIISGHPDFIFMPPLTSNTITTLMLENDAMPSITPGEKNNVSNKSVIQVGFRPSGAYTENGKLYLF